MADTYLRLDRRTPAPDVYGKPGVSYPYGSLASPRIVEEFTARVNNPVPAYLSAHPNGTAYPNAVLMQIIPAKGDNTDRKYTLVYETLPSTLLSSLRVDDAQADGALVVDTKQQLVSTTAAPSIDFKTLAYSDEAIDANHMERNLAVLQGSSFPVLSGFKYDEYTGGILSEASQLVDASAATGAALSGGVYTIVEPVNNVRSRAITRQATTLTSRNWNTGRYVSLPPVLIAGPFTSGSSLIVFNDTNGNVIYQGYYIDLRDYSGNYVVNVTETWSSAIQTITGPTSLVGTSFNWITPFGNGQIPKCLHAALSVTGNTASDGSTPAGYGRYYASMSWSFTSPATATTALAGQTITITDEQHPHMGGWLRTTETITIPT